MAIVLSETGEASVTATEGLWLDAADAGRVTGWTLKPEGMCRDDVCVPIAVHDARVDIGAFWQLLGRPVVHDATRQVWALGAGADQRNAALSGLTAPDFTLPDLAGTPHTLSALRGSKVFLATWASW